MKKPYNIIIVLILIMNILMGIALFQQNSLLTEYKHRITNLEGKMEDIDDAIEETIIPILQKTSDGE